MNTYTDKQVANALDILEDVWGDQQAYIDLSEDKKSQLAEIVLRAFKIEPKA